MLPEQKSRRMITNRATIYGGFASTFSFGKYILKYARSPHTHTHSKTDAFISICDNIFGLNGRSHFRDVLSMNLNFIYWLQLHTNATFVKLQTSTSSMCACVLCINIWNLSGNSNEKSQYSILMMLLQLLLLLLQQQQQQWHIKW